MNSSDYIKIISFLRHDFLNHLQVISGYLQLNKSDMAREYIQGVTSYLQGMSKIVHLNIPEAAAAFLLGEEKALRIEARTKYNVQSNLEDCTVPGHIAGRVVEGCIEAVIDCMENYGEDESPLLEVDIKDMEEGCGCVFSFIATGGSSNLNNWLSQVMDEISGYGIRLELDGGEDRWEKQVRLIFPAGKK